MYDSASSFYDTPREQELRGLLSSFIDDLPNSDIDFIKEKKFDEHAIKYLDYMYSQNELMHIFYTNTRIGDYAEEIDTLLFRNTMTRFIKYYKKWMKNINLDSLEDNRKAYDDLEEFLEESTQSFVSKLILDTCLEFMAKVKQNQLMMNGIELCLHSSNSRKID